MSAGVRGGPANRPASRGMPRQTAAQAQSTDALANQAGRGGVMGMPGQGMATAGAPVKERDQKGPTVANGKTGQGKAGQNRLGRWPGSILWEGSPRLDPSLQHITYCHIFIKNERYPVPI